MHLKLLIEQREGPRLGEEVEQILQRFFAEFLVEVVEAGDVDVVEMAQVVEAGGGGRIPRQAEDLRQAAAQVEGKVEIAWAKRVN